MTTKRKLIGALCGASVFAIVYGIFSSDAMLVLGGGVVYAVLAEI